MSNLARRSAAYSARGYACMFGLAGRSELNQVDFFFRKTTKDNEDTVSDLLCSMMRYRFCRKLVLKYIHVDSTIIDKVDKENISTELEIQCRRSRYYYTW